MNKAKTVKLTIYLVKDKNAKHSSIIELGGAQEPVSLELAGGYCTLYIKSRKITHRNGRLSSHQQGKYQMSK